MISETSDIAFEGLEMVSEASDIAFEGLGKVSETSDTYYDFKRMFPPSE